MNISFSKLIEDSKKLASQIPEQYYSKETPEQYTYSNIYGVPNGGILPAFIIAQELGLSLVSKKEINKNTLIVDDLIDSGETLKEFDNDTAVLYRKNHSPKTTYVLDEVDGWIDLPHEEEGGKAVEKNIVRVLEYLGEDPTREGLRDTPKRVIKSYKELYSGYNKEVKDILTVFDGEKYDEMVVLKDIEFYSNCEHHMLPFFGKAHIAYIPNGKVIGISKLARIVDIYSRRLQNQERLTKQVAEALQEHLEPLGVAVVMEAQHFCMRSRGVGKQNSLMKTAHLTGVFREEGNNARNEFYNLIK